MLKYEWKKFFSKTANKVILAAVILIAVGYSFLAAESMSYVNPDGTHIAGAGKITAGRRLAADKNRWKGELTAERIAEAVKSYQELRWQYPQDLPDTEYGKTVQSYWDILNFAANVYVMEPAFLPDVIAQMTEEDLDHIYDIYTANLQKMAEEYGETPEQEEFIRKQYEKIELS